MLNAMHTVLLAQYPNDSHLNVFMYFGVCILGCWRSQRSKSHIYTHAQAHTYTSTHTHTVANDSMQHKAQSKCVVFTKRDGINWLNVNVVKHEHEHQWFGLVISFDDCFPCLMHEGKEHAIYSLSIVKWRDREPSSSKWMRLKCDMVRACWCWGASVFVRIWVEPKMRTRKGRKNAPQLWKKIRQ